MPGQRPTRVEIDLGALEHNFRLARRQAGPDRQVLAVVKADAYGHGAARVASALEGAGADLFGVAIVEEGVELRRAGIGLPVLVLGGLYPGQAEEALAHRLTPCLFDLESARRLDAAARSAGRQASYHLKIDTGMGRIGLRPEELPSVLSELSRLSFLTMEGVVTHLALADDPAHPFTDEQLRRFRGSLAAIRQAGFAPRLIHCSNSAALFTREIPEANLVRPGIVLYGGLPSDHFQGRLDLRPVMSLRSAVAQVKEVPAGTGISYGHRFIASRTSLVAAVPVGYADGYNRLLSGQGEALVLGRRARVAGTVCMDWILLDVSDIPGVKVGDEVTLLGADGDERISAEEWAERIGTISYEVFCQIGKRVPRTYREAVVGNQVLNLKPGV